MLYLDDNVIKRYFARDKDKNVSKIDVSIIIPCKNESSNLKWTMDSILNSYNDLKCEIIIVDDYSKDDSLRFIEMYREKLYDNIIIKRTDGVGAAKARNEGAKLAKGKYLIFCDAHIKVQNGWIDDLINTMEEYNSDLVAPAIGDISNPISIGYGQTWDCNLKMNWFTDKPQNGEEVPLIGGAALCIRKEAFEKIDGFNKLFMVWGREDEEICLKAWLYGLKIVINPKVVVWHLFRKNHPYSVSYTNVVYNSICLAVVHFNLERMDKAIRNMGSDTSFSAAICEIKGKSSELIDERNKQLREKIYEDDFFFEKFSIDF